GGGGRAAGARTDDDDVRRLVEPCWGRSGPGLTHRRRLACEDFHELADSLDATRWSAYREGWGREPAPAVGAHGHDVGVADIDGPLLSLPDAAAWEAWLEAHHG